jgi:S1-C subfamily serine protease
VPIILRVLSGARAGQVASFDKSVISIGRHPMSDMLFDPEQDRDVSTRHGEIRIVSGQYMIRDNKSTNGTYVNGTLIEAEHLLRQGDVVSFGRTGPQIKIDLDGSLGPAVAPPYVAPKPRRPTPPGVPEPRFPTLNERLTPPAQPAQKAPPRASRSTTARIAVAVGEHTRQIKRMFAGAVVLLLLGAVGAWWMGKREADEARKQLAALIGDIERREKAWDSLMKQSEGRIAVLDTAYSQNQKTIQNLRLRVETQPTDGQASRELQDALTKQDGVIQAAQINYKAINAANGGAVALIYVQMPSGARFSGTGFSITPGGLVVTNRHLMRDDNGQTAEKLAVTFSNSDKVLRAHLVRVSENSDLAFIQIDDPGPYKTVKGIVPSERNLDVGDAVASIAFPLGIDLPMDGKVMTASFEPGTVGKKLANILQLTTYAAQGSSGSPVFDSNGYVVGVIYGGPREAQGRIVYAVPSEKLIAELPAEARGIVK